MSLPTDVQYLCEQIEDLMRRYNIHDLCFRGALRKSGDIQQQIELQHYQQSWKTQMTPTEGCAHALQERIRQSIEAGEQAQAAIRSQINDGERALAENEQQIERARNLIPPPLIELAQCAAAEEEIKAEDLNWLDEQDLPF
jgi:hypothetical protein